MGAVTASLKTPLLAGYLGDKRGTPAPPPTCMPQWAKETTPTAASKISFSGRGESCELLRCLITAEMNHPKP